MRRGLISLAIAATCLTGSVAAEANTAATSQAVTLRLPSVSLHAGHQVQATFVNATASSLELAVRPTLARDVDGRWVAVSHSHGADVACPSPDPVFGAVRAHTKHALSVELYDDLAPGTYRLTVLYQAGDSPRALGSHSPTAAVMLRVTRFDPGPAPHLSESRLLAIALQAAKTDGDAHPTLIQHAEGTRALVALIASHGVLVNAWNWSYLIAERGTFETPVIPSPPGVPTGPGPVRLHFRVIALMVNARTGQVSDTSGGGGRYPNLAALGPVTTDRGG